MEHSTEQLTSFLKSVLAKDEQKEAVGPIHIPESKQELLEFFSTLRPQMRNSEILVDVYEEAVAKADRLFPGDPDFQRYVCESEDRIKEIRQELKTKEEDQTIGKIFLFILAFLVIGALMVFAL